VHFVAFDAQLGVILNGWCCFRSQKVQPAADVDGEDEPDGSDRGESDSDGEQPDGDDEPDPDQPPALLDSFMLPNGREMVRSRKALIVAVPKLRPEKHGDEYYYSLLMLYLPWRDEKKLLAGHASAQEAFKAQRKQLQLQHAGGFTDIDGELQDIEVRAAALADNELVGGALAIAAGGRIDAIDAYQHAIDLESSQPVHFSPDDRQRHRVAALEEVDQSERQDVRGMPSVPAMQQDEYKRCLGGLGPEQALVFNLIVFYNKAVALADRTGAPRPELPPLFITGGAGTGKSFLIRCLIEHIRRLSAGRPLPVRLCAPTGVAAFLIGGATLHTALRLPVQKRGQGKYIGCGPDALKAIKTSWGGTEWLIIDEISMVSSEMMVHIDLRLREIMGKEVPFGGLHVIAVGDFYQLKPVAASWIFQDPKRGDQQIGLVENTWRSFVMLELQQNQRQKGDQEFLSLLNRCRVGAPSPADFATLKGRLLEQQKKQKKPKKGEEKKAAADPVDPLTLPLRLCPTRALCDDYNSECLAQLRKHVHVFTARIRHGCGYGAPVGIAVDVSDAQEPLDLDSDPEDEEYAEEKKGKQAKPPKAKRGGKQKKLPQHDENNHGGMRLNLEMCLGARVMLRRNIDVTDGLVNGALGTVAGFAWCDGAKAHKQRSLPAAVFVEFDNEKVGLTSLALPSRLTCPGYPRAVAISPKEFPIDGDKGSGAIKYISQVPLVLCWATTIHKSQGLTLQRAEVMLRNIYTPGQAYVAISRVTQLSGLDLIAFDTHSIKADTKVVNEYKRLRADAARKIPLLLDSLGVDRKAPAQADAAADDAPAAPAAPADEPIAAAAAAVDAGGAAAAAAPAPMDQSDDEPPAPPPLPENAWRSMSLQPGVLPR
jgi:hypothetical protein